MNALLASSLKSYNVALFELFSKIQIMNRRISGLETKMVIGMSGENQTRSYYGQVDPQSVTADRLQPQVVEFAQSTTQDNLVRLLEVNRVTLFKSPKLIADRRRDGVGTGLNFPNVYIDGSHAFVLADQSQEVAIVGFDLDDSKLTVKQLQWVSAQKPNGRWEKALLKVTEDFAKETPANQVEVRPSSENGWVKLGRMNADTAHLRYDVTPTRCGFQIINGKAVKSIK